MPQRLAAGPLACYVVTAMNEPLPRLLREGPIGFTAAEFLHMGDVGAFDDMKVELIGGQIQRMTPPMNEHAERQASVVIRLSRVVPENLLRGEVSVEVSGDTIVGCDAAMLRHPVAGRRSLRADDLLLVVEVAETTADRDLDVKRRLYAAVGVPHYWVIDGKRRVTHVFGQPGDGEYSEVAIIPFGQPLPVPGTHATIIL